MKIVVDLDDTLVNTTTLNNDAYNFALEFFGFKRIESKDRLTRDSLSFLSEKDKIKVITLKQSYFTKRWLKYRIVLNNELINIISNSKQNCYLWTKASKDRVEEILKVCKLKKYFKCIIYDQKTSFEKSLKLLMNTLDTKSLVIFENNHDFFSNYNLEVIKTIKNNYFYVKGYLIN